MAPVAVTTESADVYVIAAVTSKTLLRNTVVLFEREPMTVITDRLPVFPLKRIFSLFVMIECPQQPIIRVVAFTTLLTKPTLVGIVRLMAGETFDIGLLKLCIQMTGLAGSDAVNTD